MPISRSLRDASIATRLFAILALLTLTTAIAGGSAIHIMRVYSEKVTAMQRASERAIIGEQVNGLINAVVMDSRGVYMAKDPAEVEKFGVPLLKNLTNIKALMARWSPLVDSHSRAAFEDCEKQVTDFVTLRTAVVEAGRTLGAAAADKIGNNDANRANRQAFNKAIVVLAGQNEREIAMLAEELARFEASVSTVLPAATAGGIVVVVALAVLLIVGGITRPLGRITQAIRLLASGDLHAPVTGQDRTHEIGRIAAALEVFRRQAVENQALIEAREQEREATEQQKRAALVAMAERIEAAAGGALAMVGDRCADLAVIADDMRELADRTGSSAQGAVSAASQVLENARTVASAAEELSVSIREISLQVSHSSGMIREAVSAGGETRVTIEALNERVGRIGSVVDMIKDIAGKTNLLALNATIEAARAGEAGKGFAVVASEVKQLANQTARSTEEITRHIAEVRSATGEAVGAVSRIEATIGRISEISDTIAEAIEEQGAATVGIARSVAETAAAVNEMSTRNAEVSAAANEGREQAARVLTMTRGMGIAVDELKVGVIRAVRTSTNEVNRRAIERLSADVPCRIEVAGQIDPEARITDISMGGARVMTGLTPPMGSPGTLRIANLARPATFVVRGLGGDGLRLAFDLDDSGAAEIRAWMERTALAPAA